MKNNPLFAIVTSAVVLLCGSAALPVSAQLAEPPPTAAYQPLSAQQLDQLLGPIALYPDPLLAQILPAATLPTEIVLADRYLASGGDPNLASQQPWDASVQALVRYPTVLQYLDKYLTWTAELGQAFLNQQQDVMDAIQRLRASAQNYGNLVSAPQQEVVDDDGEIEILPVNPDVLYLPVFLPGYVYFQSGYGITFGAACAIGPWLNCDFDWSQHHLFFWGAGQARPANWWRERPDQRRNWMAHAGTVWQPDNHRNAGRVAQGDRGWSQGNNSHGIPNHNPPVINPARPAETPRAAIISRPEAKPAPVAAAPVYNSAFVGSDSTRDVRAYSDRGQESMRTAAPPEPVREAPPEAPHYETPVSRPEPSYPESGGGGGRR